MSTTPLPEPWLRGDITDVHPILAPILYSFRQAIEDCDRFTAGLSDEQIWHRPSGIGSIGFHLRHIAGSVDRLITYALGNQLSETQLAQLKQEMEPGATRAELLAAMRTSLDNAAAAIRAIDPATAADARAVGRKQLPTTVIGLLIHVAEHTQRHVGQVIVLARLAAARQ